MEYMYRAENLVVPLLGVTTVALIFVIYHLIAICLWGRLRTNQQNQQQSLQAANMSHNNVISYPLARLIPIHKYHKKRKVDGDEGGNSSTTCAVCLADFEEGEELRTLPQCMHSFHVPCIDMWLYSHASCPICRATAIPFPVMLQHGPVPGVGYAHNHLNNPQHSINMVQIAPERS